MLDPPEQYWRIGPYLSETEEIEQVEKGIFIRFLHRPLGRYVNAMADVGLGLERLLEPPPPPGFLARAPEYGAADTIPRLLTLVATKRDVDVVSAPRPLGGARRAGARTHRNGWGWGR